MESWSHTKWSHGPTYKQNVTHKMESWSHIHVTHKNDSWYHAYLPAHEYLKICRTSGCCTPAPVLEVGVAACLFPVAVCVVVCGAVYVAVCVAVCVAMRVAECVTVGVNSCLFPVAVCTAVCVTACVTVCYAVRVAVGVASCLCPVPTCKWVMSHIWMSHHTRMNESCHVHEQVMAHVWVCAATGCVVNAAACLIHVAVCLAVCVAVCVAVGAAVSPLPVATYK